MRLRPLVTTLTLALALPAWGDQGETLSFLRAAVTAPALPAPDRKPTNWDETNEVKLLAKLAIAAYQGLLSTQDGPTCTFGLSCSQYAKGAIERYGLFVGVLMASDRLQRCYPMNASYYSVDPLTGKLNDPLP